MKVQKKVRVAKKNFSPKVIFCLETMGYGKASEDFAKEVFPNYIPNTDDLVRTVDSNTYKVTKVVHTTRDGVHTILAFVSLIGD